MELDMINDNNDLIKENKFKEEKKNKLIKILIISFVSLLIILIFILALTNKGDRLNIDMTGSYEYGGYKNEYYFIKDNNLYAYKGDNLRYVIKVKDDSKFSVDKRNLYLSMDNNLYIFDKKEAKEKETVNFDSKIYNIEIIDDKKIIYMENSLIVLDENNSILEEYKVDGVAIDYTKGEATNILGINKDILSNFKIYKSPDEKILEISTGELLIYDQYIDERRHILASDKAIYLYDLDKLVKRIGITKLNGIDIDEEEVAILDGRTLLTYDKDLNILDKRDVDFDGYKLIYQEDEIYILSNNQVYIYSEEVDKGIKTIDAKDIFSNGEDIYLIYKDGMERYR